MIRTMLKSKIHRATVTEANLEYEGSVTIDATLMDAADLLPYEQVQIYDCTNGSAAHHLRHPRRAGLGGDLHQRRGGAPREARRHRDHRELRAARRRRGRGWRGAPRVRGPRQSERGTSAAHRRYPRARGREGEAGRRRLRAHRDEPARAPHLRDPRRARGRDRAARPRSEVAARRACDPHRRLRLRARRRAVPARRSHLPLRAGRARECRPRPRAQAAAASPGDLAARRQGGGARTSRWCRSRSTGRTGAPRWSSRWRAGERPWTSARRCRSASTSARWIARSRRRR